MMRLGVDTEVCGAVNYVIRLQEVNMTMIRLESKLTKNNTNDN